MSGLLRRLWNVVLPCRARRVMWRDLAIMWRRQRRAMYVVLMRDPPMN